jgi:hypothetical protein
MAKYRFLINSPNTDELQGAVIKAKSLGQALKKMHPLVSETETIISIDVEVSGRWHALRGQITNDVVINEHRSSSPGEPVTGPSQNLSGSELKPVVQFHKSAFEIDKAAPDLSHSRRSTAPTIEVSTPAIVTVLWIIAGMVALGSVLFIIDIDFRYLSSEMTAGIIVGIFVANIACIAFASAMSYLHKVSHYTKLNAQLLEKLVAHQLRCSEGLNDTSVHETPNNQAQVSR